MRYRMLYFKEFYQNIRDLKTNGLMILLPSSMIVLLSSVFGNFFNSFQGVKFKYVEVFFPGGQIKADALSYYAVTMITMSIMYLTVVAAGKILEERKNGTLKRLMQTGCSPTMIFISKATMLVIIGLAQVSLVMFITHRFFGGYFGENPIQVFILLTSEIFYCISVGFCIGFLVEENKIAFAIVQFFIILWGLFGGTFYPLESTKFAMLSDTSLLRMLNDSMFSLIYSSDAKILAPVLICLAQGSIASVLSLWLIKNAN